MRKINKQQRPCQAAGGSPLQKRGGRGCRSACPDGWAQCASGLPTRRASPHLEGCGMEGSRCSGKREGFPVQGSSMFCLLRGQASPRGTALTRAALPAGDALMLTCCVSAHRSLPLPAWAGCARLPPRSLLLMIFICFGSVFKLPRPSRCSAEL